MDILYGSDYQTRPYLELESHPDFNRAVYEMMTNLSRMSTEQLDNLIVLNGGI